MPKMSPQELDDYVVRVWASKKQSCKERGIEWKMSLTSLKNILRAEKCYYTGIKLQVPTRGVDRIDDMSIDRIDASLPYQKGNVVACCRWANGLKNVIESQQSKNNILSFKAAEKVMRKTIKRMEEQVNV